MLMASPATHSCPLPEVLGAFLEGRLDERTRNDVQAHVASCPECILVLGETSRGLAAEEDSAGDPEGDAHPRPRWWQAAIAAAVVLVSILAGYAAMRDPLASLRRTAANATRRPVEGRLNAFPYRPYSASRSEGSTHDLALTLEAKRLLHLQGGGARVWHTRAVAQLVLGKPETAVSLLKITVRLEPLQAPYWNDLAAAYLAMPADDASTLRAALHACDRAMILDPSAADPYFNRALTLARLGDRSGAAATYTYYISLDPGSPWSEEARRRRAFLTR
jgi:tetratricopeptide (TPR) repeat protein